MEQVALTGRYKVTRPFQHLNLSYKEGEVFTGITDSVARHLMDLKCIVMLDPEPYVSREPADPDSAWPPVPLLWPGETIAIVCRGPSYRKEEIEKAMGRARVIAVNDAYRDLPWADMLYACDPAWWDLYGPDHVWPIDGLFYEGAADFKGIKVTQNKDAAEKWGLSFIPSNAGATVSFNPKFINTGGNSGFQALNLAALLGASRIILYGMDMKVDENGRKHDFGDHPGVLNRTSPSDYISWQTAFRKSELLLKEHHIEVVNCAEGGGLNCFPYYSLEKALLLPKRRPASDQNVPKITNQEWMDEVTAPPRRVASFPIPEDHRFPPRLKKPGASQPEAPCTWTGSVTFACVLRPSNDFGVAEVERLSRMIARHTARDYRLVCLTEVKQNTFSDPVIEAVPLKHPEWQTKHSKIELFRPDLLEDWGRVIYFDLDTVIMGSLEEICGYYGAFAMLRDFFCSRMNGSGMMAWGPDERLAEIYEDFCRMDSSLRAGKYHIGGGHGDQLFIRHHTPIAPHQIQDCFPGQIGSYKAHFRNRPKPSVLPRVICFHGRPKPSEILDEWIREHYR